MDVFSRYPASKPTDKEIGGDEELEKTVREFSVSAALVVDPTVDQVKEETMWNKVLQQLVGQISKGFPKERTNLKEELRAFWNDRHKLTVADGIVMCNDRIVVPRKLRQGVLEELNAAHQG